MPRVICRVSNCAHNIGDEICNAYNIEINEDGSCINDTDCSTFIPRDLSGSLLSLDNVNYSGLVTEAFSGKHCTDPCLRCDVNDCRYNDGSDNCLAGEIEILSGDSASSTETCCGTYSPL